MLVEGLIFSSMALSGYYYYWCNFILFDSCSNIRRITTYKVLTVLGKVRFQYDSKVKHTISSFYNLSKMCLLLLILINCTFYSNLCNFSLFCAVVK